MISSKSVKGSIVTLLTFILVVSLTLCCGRSDQEGNRSGPPSPIVIERWPGEGIPIIAWRGPGDSLTVYSQPGTTTPARHVAVVDGQQLSWDRSVILLEQTGQMRILEDCIISGFVYDTLDDGKLKGGRAQQINFSSGTILEVICYAAEGYYIFRHDGEYIEMGSEHRYQQMLTPPQTQWWVRMKSDGKSTGWILVDEEQVVVVDRRF